MLEVKQFTRKPFPVDAVKVTAANMELAAEWCNGDVRVDSAGKKYVKVRVHRPQGDRQSMAYPGDRILYAGSGYKVYTPRAFEASFTPMDGPPVEVSRPAPAKKQNRRPVPGPPRKAPKPVVKVAVTEQ